MTITSHDLINDLVAAADNVIACWSQGNLAAAVNELQLANERLKANVNEDLIEAAKEASGWREDIDIDSYPLTSETDDGTWVMAWVFVPNEEG